VKDLAPIARIGTAQFVLVTRPSLEARSVKDLLALARSRPGQLKYASSGNGTEPHLSGELLKSLGDLDIIHVPYKGGAPSVAAVMSGEVDFGFQAIIAALSNIKSGRLKALAVTGRSRSSALPGVPTMIESGLPDFEVTGWYAVLGPDGVPDAIVRRLNQEIGAALNEPDVKERFERLGTEVAFSTPSELTALIKHDAARWARLVKLSGARIE
jgi:tripartite-type tricarboxylate transporter receptor subunit TctC